MTTPKDNTTAGVGDAPGPMNWHKYLTYDEGSGDLIWKPRPREWFVEDRRWKTWNIRYAGKAAGHKSKHRGGDSKLVNVCIHTKIYKAHTIIWEMMHGPIPDGLVIDHADGNPFNNRLVNLRLATRADNARNCKTPAHNTSGLKGASWSKGKGKWVAAINVDSRTVHLGCYDTKEDAHAAYAAAAALRHGKYARTS